MQLIWTFTWETYLFSPLIFSFDHLSISVWTHGYLFYTLGYNPQLLYLLLAFFQLWPVAALSIDYGVPLAYTHQCTFLFISFSFQHFLNYFFNLHCWKCPFFLPLTPCNLHPHLPHPSYYHPIVCVHQLCIYASKFLGWYLSISLLWALQDAQAHLMSFSTPILESAISSILFSCLLSTLVLSTILYSIDMRFCHFLLTTKKR